MKLSDISAAWIEWSEWLKLLEANPGVWCYQFGACQAQARLVITQALYHAEVKP